MATYILIESREPFESRDTQFIVETATSLKKRGNAVVVFLLQNGVLAARAKAHGSHLPLLAKAGVHLLADDFSMRERGFTAEDLGDNIQEEEHPTTKNFVGSLLELGKDKPLLTWVNCGLCVDERGAGNWIEGVKRGGPADFLQMTQESNNTLVIPTK